MSEFAERPFSLGLIRTIKVCSACNISLKLHFVKTINKNCDLFLYIFLHDKNFKLLLLSRLFIGSRGRITPLICQDGPRIRFAVLKFLEIHLQNLSQRHFMAIFQTRKCFLTFSVTKAIENGDTSDKKVTLI